MCKSLRHPILLFTNLQITFILWNLHCQVSTKPFKGFKLYFLKTTTTTIDNSLYIKEARFYFRDHLLDKNIIMASRFGEKQKEASATFRFLDSPRCS